MLFFFFFLFFFFDISFFLFFFFFFFFFFFSFFFFFFFFFLFFFYYLVSKTNLTLKFRKPPAFLMVRGHLLAAHLGQIAPEKKANLALAPLVDESGCIFHASFNLMVPMSAEF